MTTDNLQDHKSTYLLKVRNDKRQMTGWQDDRWMWQNDRLKLTIDSWRACKNNAGDRVEDQDGGEQHDRREDQDHGWI